MMKLLLLCFLLAAITAFHAVVAAQPNGAKHAARSAYWIFLVDGPNAATSPELNQAGMDKMQADHIKNLERLGKEGRSFGAGPVGGSDLIRGIVMLKSETPETLKEAFAQDPYVRRGILRVDAHACSLDAARFGTMITPFAMARHTIVLLKKGAKWASPATLFDLLPGQRAAYRSREPAVAVSFTDAEGDIAAVLMYRSPDYITIRQKLEAEPGVKNGIVTLHAFSQFMGAGVFGPAGRVMPTAGRRTRLFDGKSFAGWEGDTQKTWRIANGALVGGSLSETVPHNDFLTTTKDYTNFDLRLKVKLEGTGFVNGGIQLRSKRTADPPYEMSGYQADMGEGYWASLYDESRRNKTLQAPKAEVLKAPLKPNDWNDYVIRCEGRRIRLWLNGTLTVDFLEEDETIPLSGKIGLQIHGGGKSEASYKEITIAELP